MQNIPVDVQPRRGGLSPATPESFRDTRQELPQNCRAAARHVPLHSGGSWYQVDLPSPYEDPACDLHVFEPQQDRHDRTPVWLICLRFVPLTQGPRILETRRASLPCRTGVVLQRLVHELPSLHTPELATRWRVPLYIPVFGRCLRFRAESRMRALHHPEK